ncbi:MULTISPECIES: hypothetical protein [unclassified Neochlamydia]|uniref:hypothetical protein n=1 Tax=unclassified Neochlamydia TaxID=2643326 RepID=UPI001407D71B|nr:MULTISPECIES: hypothetical protein [unclassified Neochlamydia]MBS4166630.1 Uncharacterized protein [Neochlamydia sp. AcF65]MBS4171339.1 Uncharacterized protein [Neochlamydia sp. AcF95]NGY94786.1 hypothetical protein [Neochlamydia sp. AcF84]
MKKFKKMIALTTLLAICGSTVDISAQEYVSNVGGICYEESRQAHSLAPAIALGTIAAVAIIAVAVQNRSHGHGHGHAH